MAQDWTNFKNHIAEGDARLAPSPTSADNGKVLTVVNGVTAWQDDPSADKATKPTTGSLGTDSSLDDVIAKVNTLISELKA